MLFTSRATLNVHALAPVWGELTNNQNSVLTIVYANTKKQITPRQQFENFFYNRQLIHFDADQACLKFLMILNDETSTFILQQLKKATDFLNKLSELENWQHETTYISDNTYHNDTKSNTTNSNIARSATSDNNSNMAIDNIKGFLSTNIKDIKDNGIAIEANVMNASLNDDHSDNNSDVDGTSNTNSTTKMGNTADDILRFFKIEILPIRNRFWSRFDCLFRD